MVKVEVSLTRKLESMLRDSEPRISVMQEDGESVELGARALECRLRPPLEPGTRLTREARATVTFKPDLDRLLEVTLMEPWEPEFQGALKASLETDAKMVREVKVMDSFWFGAIPKFTLEMFPERRWSKEVLEARRRGT